MENNITESINYPLFAIEISNQLNFTYFFFNKCVLKKHKAISEDFLVRKNSIFNPSHFTRGMDKKFIYQ